jgi:hypothetical protein
MAMSRTARVLATPVLLAVIALVTVSSSHALEDAYPSFFTTGKVVYCTVGMDITGDHYIPPYLFCWEPANGFTVSMTAHGRVHRSYRSRYKRLYSPYPRRALRFWQSWWTNRRGAEGTGTGRGDLRFVCKSHPRGLTCTNMARHGFWLGRRAGDFRIF